MPIIPLVLAAATAFFSSLSCTLVTEEEAKEQQNELRKEAMLSRLTEAQTSVEALKVGSSFEIAHSCQNSDACHSELQNFQSLAQKMYDNNYLVQCSSQITGSGTIFGRQTEMMTCNITNITKN